MAVYFIRSNDAVKIGYSKDPRSRMSAFLNANSAHVELIRTVPGNRKTEKWFHDFYRKKRIVREWFSFCESMLSTEAPIFEDDPPMKRHRSGIPVTARDDEIVSRYRKRLSLREIAREMKISHEWVRKILLRRNVKLRPVGVH